MSEAADPARILLIDDDDLSREVLELLLAGEGWDVQAASSGEQAVGLVRHDHRSPWIVLSDLQMPGLCGSELATVLRAIPQAKLRVFLAMSASRPAGGTPTGYDAFLLKPFTMRHFSAVLADLETSAAEATPGLRDPAASESEQIGNAPQVLDEVTLEGLRTSMRVHQLTDLFELALRDAEGQLDVMRTAAETADVELYRRCAHSMKGSFGLLGARELQSMAAAAEHAGFADAAAEVTTRLRFSDALVRLRLTLVTRGVCPP